jgi:hypothetical protein
MLSLAPCGFSRTSAGVEGRTPTLHAGARVETTGFPKIFDLQVAFGLDTAGRCAAAYSTNGYLLKQTVS